MDKKSIDKKIRSILDTDFEDLDSLCNPKIKYYDSLTGEYIPKTVEEAIKLNKKRYF